MTTTSIFLHSLLGLWRKLLSLRPARSLFRHILILWRALRAKSFGKPGGGCSRDEGTKKSILDQRLAVRQIPKDDIIICASRIPASAYSASASTSPMSIPIELPSRPSSVASNFSSRRASNITFLTPYSFPNVSRASHDSGVSPLSPLPESPGSAIDERGRMSPQMQIHSSRRSSRASSRRSLHVESGVYTRRPSRERLERGSINHSHSRLNLGHEAPVPKNSGDTAVNPPIPLPSIYKEKKLYPTVTTAIERYDRKISLPKKADNFEFVIPPMTLSFSRVNVPDGWTACTHPEGALYFFHKARRIYTDAYICEVQVCHEVESFAAALESHAQKEGIIIPEDAELVLEIQPEANGDTSWSYYYVDNVRRTLFWIHDFDISWHISELVGLPSLPHLKHEIERYYWLHVEYFPYGHNLGEQAMKELMGILIHAISDQLTSPYSTILFSVDILSKMLSIAKEIKAFGSSDETVCIHGRLMNVFAHPRFLNYHGQYGARLNRDQSVHDHGPKPRSFLVKILAPALYNAPYVHLQALEKTWIDDTMCHQPWEQFIEKLKGEWQEFILYATVLLNANVAFLAIPSVDPGDNALRTPAQVVSYISIVTSTGAIIIGLLLIRQYRVKPRETVEEAAKFLSSQSHPTRGMETLAILYSLPYALLMWGMLTFLGAFSLECFTTSDRPAIITSSVVWFLVTFLILWCIYTAWESDEPLWQYILTRMQEKMETVRETNRAFLHRVFPRKVSEDAATTEDSVEIQIEVP